MAIISLAEVVVLKCVFYHGQKRLKQAEVASSGERWWVMVMVMVMVFIAVTTSKSF